MISHISSNFLPGTIVLSPGTAADYRTLQRFHYLPTRPATWAAIVSARYEPAPGIEALIDPPLPKLVGVGVLSWPSAMHRGRNAAFDLKRLGYGARIRWANANVRTISRVIVHPQFRSVGLSRALIDWLCDCCTTPYIEASARMGRAHPMFDRAGFARIEPASDGQPIYYWRKTKFDRTNPISAPSAGPAGD